MFHKIANVKPLVGKLLWVEFRDGSESVYNAEGLVSEYEPFRELLNDRAMFSSVKVDAGGYGVSWNDDLDLSAEELWNNGVRLKEPVTLAPGCSCPVCGQKIRKKSPAQIAASRANLAKRTHKGGRPINPDSKRQQRLALKVQRAENLQQKQALMKKNARDIAKALF